LFSFFLYVVSFVSPRPPHLPLSLFFLLSSSFFLEQLLIVLFVIPVHGFEGNGTEVNLDSVLAARDDIVEKRGLAWLRVLAKLAPVIKKYGSRVISWLKCVGTWSQILDCAPKVCFLKILSRCWAKIADLVCSSLSTALDVVTLRGSAFLASTALARLRRGALREAISGVWETHCGWRPLRYAENEIQVFSFLLFFHPFV
jgi:hypothetical protein